MCRFMFGSTCNKRLDFPMIQWKKNLKIGWELLHWLHIFVWTFPLGRIVSSSYIHCDKRHTSLRTTAIAPIDDELLGRRDRILQARIGSVFSPWSFLYSKWQKICFCDGCLLHFCGGTNESCLNRHFQIHQILNRHDTREIVLVMVVLHVLFQIFFFELYQDCGSTFIASQKLSIPWFIIALYCKNGEGCLSSISFIDCSKKDHE